jgi:hypothetical protein
MNNNVYEGIIGMVAFFVLISVVCIPFLVTKYSYDGLSIPAFLFLILSLLLRNTESEKEERRKDWEEQKRHWEDE